MTGPERTRHAARSSVVTLFGQWGKYVIQVGSMVVLARILSPTDFGVFAIIAVFSGIALILSDFGLYLAAVRAPSLTRQQKSSLFWINSGIGLGLWALLCILAFPLSAIYGNPDLIALLSVSGVAVAFAGAAVQFRAELARTGRFGSLALVDVGAQSLALVAAVLVAIANYGPWALVTQLVVAQLGALVIAVVVAHWLPGLPRRTSDMGELLSFGSKTLGTSLANYVSVNTDTLAVGYVWGPASLGLYSRAFQLAAIPIQQLATPLSKVAIPALSRIQEPDDYRRSILRTQSMIMYVVVGLTAFIVAAPWSVLSIVLGPQWEAAAPILRVLALGSAIQALGYVHYWIFASRGRMGLLFALEGAGRVVMVALVLLLVSFGPLWVAVAMTAGHAAIWIAVGGFGLRHVDTRLRDLMAVSFRPLVLWGSAATLGAFLENALRAAGVGPLISATAVVALFAVCVALSLLSPSYRNDYLRILRMINAARGKS